VMAVHRTGSLFELETEIVVRVEEIDGPPEGGCGHLGASPVDQSQSLDVPPAMRGTNAWKSTCSAGRAPRLRAA